MTETITNISEALNASRDARDLEKVPAQANPGPDRSAGGQGSPDEGAGPEGPDGTVDEKGNKGEERARAAQDTSDDRECNDAGAPSPRPEHAIRPGSQMPGAEGEQAQGGNENCPPQCKLTRDWPGDREDGGAGPTAADGGPRDEEASPPSPPRRPEALEGGARAGEEERPPSPAGMEEARHNEDPSEASLTPSRTPS